MNSLLAQVLVSRGAIQRGTIVHAYQHVKNLSCDYQTEILADFVIQRARLLSGKRVLFDALDCEQVLHTMASEQIIKIDGMEIDRIARSHNLSLDGGDLASSRRGRRKRHITA